MARVLIVGCGCRGQWLAKALVTDGMTVRGTSRTEARFAAISASGAEPALVDPLYLGTMLPALEGVSALVWLMGSAEGPQREVEPINRERLTSMLDLLVDTPVRGVVFEGAGTLPPAHLQEGARAVQRASKTFQMPVAVLGTKPSDRAQWLAEARTAVQTVLSGPPPSQVGLRPVF